MVGKVNQIGADRHGLKRYWPGMAPQPRRHKALLNFFARETKSRRSKDA
jgi:hypothetical protein